MHLTKLARQSACNSSLDEMVWLLNSSMQANTSRELPHVRRVVYSNHDDILSLLSGQSQLRAEAPEFKPKNASMDTEELEDEDVIVENLPNPPESETQEGLTNVTQVQSFTQAEKDAAISIQHVYRIYRAKHQLSGTPREAARKVYFEQCLKQAQNMQLPYGIYRMLFLGPLAHALLCADKIQQAIFAAKKKAKGQLLDVKHEDLENIRARQTKSK
jgi:hypothetical protein